VRNGVRENALYTLFSRNDPRRNASVRTVASYDVKACGIWSATPDVRCKRFKSAREVRGNAAVGAARNLALQRAKSRPRSDVAAYKCCTHEAEDPSGLFWIEG